MAKNNYYMGQEILFLTTKWGKDYYLMRDGDGTHYMVPVGEDLYPDFSRL